MFVEHRSDTEPPRSVGKWQAFALGLIALTAAAVLIALVVTLSGANRERDRALRLQQDSYDVMILARTLAGTIARSEASLGRYVISADKQQGQLYYEQWTQAGLELERLDRITNADQAQDAALRRLRAAYDKRGGELSETARATNFNKNEQAFALFYQSSRSDSLDIIPRELDAISVRERALLATRGKAALSTVKRASRVASVLAVFGMLLVLGAIALGWISLRADNERALARADAEAAQERAEALTRAVAEATAELRVQEAKLRQAQKMDAVGQLTGGIAHDFNNMLAVVIGGIELARRSKNAASVNRHLDSAADGASRAAALTRRLLAFSREDALKPEPIDPTLLIAEMSDLLDRTLGDGITLDIRGGDIGWLVRADRVQLENVVLNLAVNARDAVNGRGSITVTTGASTLAAEAVGHCAAGDYVTIAVADDGCGMTPDVADRVFEPFFTTKEAGKGTGLGLSQIFGFVRQHDGEIAIDTAPGEGTTVTLYLPRDLTQPDTGNISEAAPDPEPNGHGFDILVVEDDSRVLNATIGALEELGHRPVACPDPLAALDMLERRPEIALIISDVLMPRQTGPEMIATLLPRFPHLGVLFVTGYAGEANAAEFGNHHLLRKPFTLAALERAVAETMNGNRLPPEQIAAE